MNISPQPHTFDTTDYSALKQKQQATWASGNYAVLGTRLQIMGELLAESLNLRAGERVLDVAAGNGNASLAAARRNTQVTATDYVESLLDKARARAQADGLEMAFQVADAEDLPFDDGEFDVSLSTVGVMFAPNQEQSAREMLRVTRSGGRIGLANWTPDGFVGRLFKIVSGYVPPPAGVQAPVLWGTEPQLVKLFGAQATDIRCQHRYYNFHHKSPAHWLAVFREYYGPVHKAYQVLDEEGQQALNRDITTLLEQMNTAGKESLVIPAEYLEAVITRE